MFHFSYAKCAAPLAISLVIVLGASTATTGQTPGTTATKGTAKVKAKAKTKALLDINKATAKEMEAELPGVGEVTAKKIIAGRPYSKVDDLAGAGVPARTIEALRPLVTVSAAPAAKTATKPAAKTAMKSATKPAAKPATGKLV